MYIASHTTPCDTRSVVSVPLVTGLAATSVPLSDTDSPVPHLFPRELKTPARVPAQHCTSIIGAFWGVKINGISLKAALSLWYWGSSAPSHDVDLTAAQASVN